MAPPGKNVAETDDRYDDTAHRNASLKYAETPKNVDTDAENADDSYLEPTSAKGGKAPLTLLPPISPEIPGTYLSGTIVSQSDLDLQAYAPLPLALAGLGFPAGIFMLALAGCVTWYTSLLLASLWRWNGNRYPRYCDLAGSIYGRGGYVAVIFFQQVASIGNNLTIQIVAGQSMKALYRLFHPECGPAPSPCGITLQAWIVIFGAVQLVISQLPDISDLKELNIFCTCCTVIFATCSLGLSIYNGQHMDRSTVSYDITGDDKTRAFNAMFALGTIAFAFGDTILPEVQATIRPNVRTNMYKGVSMAYSILLSSYLIVAIAGYWAFGNAVAPFVVQSFTQGNWAIALAYIAAIIQIVGCYQIYCRPTFNFFYRYMINHDMPVWATQNSLVRLGVTTVYMIIVTLIAAMVPFFGDFVAFVGAVGFTPVDFILPVILWLKVGEHAWYVKIVNWAIVVVYSGIAIAGAIGSVQAINADVANYHVFANLF